MFVSCGVSSTMRGNSSLIRHIFLILLFLSFYFVSSLVGIAECTTINATTTPRSSSIRRRAPVRHQLSLDFYSKTCPQVDQIVSSVAAARYRNSPASGPATIRLFYHDLPTQAGGPYYAVKKGRKDSKVSLAHKVRLNLPRANSTVDDLLRLFASKGLSKEDLVALSGAHTIGFSHCDQFVGRLYDFRGTKRPDPFMDQRLLKALQMYCPSYGGNQDVVAPFDVQTPFSFDHMYFGNLEARMGLLATDQALFVDPRTRPIVQELGRDKGKFFEAFSAGMDKMGEIRVKKGRKGEIRRDCSKHLV